MNLAFLPFGPWGVVLAAVISTVVGMLLIGLTRLWGRRHGWTHAHEIAWAWLITVIVTAGVDSWHLLYMGVTPMQSPVTIARVLSAIHDPDTLGVRVVCEFIGACVGVILGWLLWSGLWRHGWRDGRRSGGD